MAQTVTDDATQVGEKSPGRVAVFLEMIKFRHTIFALPFALMGGMIASKRAGVGGWAEWVGIVLCMVFARTSAMAFNRWADRAIDAKNPRTVSRAIPAGQLSANWVLGAVIVSGLLFVGSSSIFWFASHNPWPLFLSLPVWAVLLGYSYAKRFTSAAHFWLGVALSLSPIAAWIAMAGLPVVSGEIQWTPFLLALAVITWVAGFDIIYACQDVEVDRDLGLNSIPARLGIPKALRLAQQCHMAMVLALIGFGLVTPELGTTYWWVLTGVIVLLGVEHWLVRDRSLEKVNIAFFEMNAIISVVLLLAVTIDLYYF